MKTTTPSRIRVTLAALIGSLLLPASALAAGTEVFSTSFETTNTPSWTNGTKLTSTATNGWIGNDNDDTIYSRIASDAVNEAAHGQYLQLWDQANPGNANVKYDLGNNVTQGYIEWSLKRLTGTFYLYGYNAGGTTDAPNRNFYLSINNSTITFNSIVEGTVSTSASVEHKNISGYSSTGWNTLRLDFDNTTKTATLTVNGVPASVTGLSVSNSNTNWSLGTLHLVAGAGTTTGQSYFDDFKVVNTASNIPEPATWSAICGVLILGLSLVLRRRR
ncbi:PEP-CTERM sorting domain-containing protein [Geminisphaera colitermitum]|uniref:PEP-CTERM sorting domain-containing protein n=1 Tax=Geminisphaera colitermitum TaxID=1148786 RepID=UPI0005BC3D4B|nr:PEP-CTERM sorting domain-containing protein [Geminisphaera colitermitum]